MRWEQTWDQWGTLNGAVVAWLNGAVHTSTLTLVRKLGGKQQHIQMHEDTTMHTNRLACCHYLTAKYQAS